MSQKYNANTKHGVVKNRAPAPIQISAEQILREAADRQEPYVLKPITKIHDAEEYQCYLANRRKHFEDNIRYRREHIGTWVKYARFEEDNKDYERARSVFERALEVDHRSAELWLRYAELEMRNEFLNHSRNILDRAVSILPRVDFLWYKYLYMEEMVGNWERVREIFERWMTWKPNESAWLSYAKFEMRMSKIVTESNNKKIPNCKFDSSRATEVMKRYVNEYPCVKSFLKLAKWSEYEARDNCLARKVYEAALEELDSEEVKQAMVFSQFAAFEERRGEYERAGAIYRHAVKLFNLDQYTEGIYISCCCGKSSVNDNKKIQSCKGQRKVQEISEREKFRREELCKTYVTFQKKNGNIDSIENVVISRQRLEYRRRVDADPLDYDAWFEYAQLEEDNNSDNAAIVRYVYKSAVANIPPAQEKKYWKRYIYLWIYYALYEEIKMTDLDRAVKVYQSCLDVIPHDKFSFTKVWVYNAKLHVRRRDLESMRKLLGRAIGLCRKEKIFIEYIALELTLGEVDRCRTLYSNYLKLMPLNCRAWMKYANLELSVGEVERCRALYDLAISQTGLDIPEILWKSYIDFEIEQGDSENARKLYEKLLERTEHVKVFISYAQFEGSSIGQGVNVARSIYERGYKRLREQGLKEERVLLLDAWKLFEMTKGNDSSISDIESKMPHRVKRKQININDKTEEMESMEYIDYQFPDDMGSASSNMKILEMATKWKQSQSALT